MWITICCVLRSGGDFRVEHANALYAGAKRLIAPDCSKMSFVCFTDLVDEIEAGSFDPGISPIIPEPNWPKWWNKLHCTRLVTTPTIFFDLDTMLLKPIPELLEEVALTPETFWMLRATHPTLSFGSGIMAWNGNFSHIYQDFEWEADSHYDWDQKYIIANLHEHGVQIKTLNDHVEAHSYKKKGLQADTQILYFHGKPRPWETDLWEN